MKRVKYKTTMFTAVPLMVLTLLFSSSGYAIKSIAVYALFNNRAILLIDGERHMLRAGDISPEGVKLISSNTESALIEVNGKRETIGLAINPAKEPMSSGSVSSVDIAPSVTLDMGPRGFFHAEGEINGNSVVFLVDTGANTVAMNASTARRLDIDYEAGRKSLVSTANGVTLMYGVTLEKVSIGPIEIDNVSAAVIQDPGPAGILLGMSFLRHLEMKRAGDTMELIQR